MEKTVTTIKKLKLEGISHVKESVSRDILVIRKAADNFAVSSCGDWILYLRDSRVRVINTVTCASFTRYVKFVVSV